MRRRNLLPQSCPGTPRLSFSVSRATSSAIVLWIHVIDIHGAYTLNLDDGFFASPAEVIGLGLA